MCAKLLPPCIDILCILTVFFLALIAEQTPKTLAEKTTCMSAGSYYGGTQYNSHSVYGLQQSISTYK